MIRILFDEEAEKDILFKNKLKTYKEKWKQIEISGIRYEYEISNTGKVRNINTNKLLSTDTSGKGYIRVKLYNNGKNKRMSVHRLVAMHFVPLTKTQKKNELSFDDLVPNHKDGIKYHNTAFNLEWTTIKENTHHAFETGLAFNLTGERSHLSKMSDKKAKACCELLSQGLSTKVIAKKLNVSKTSVQHIKSRECWNWISKDYIFPVIQEPKHYTIPVSTIKSICEKLEKKDSSDNEIASIFNVSREYVKDIRLHKRRKSISKDYNF